MSEHEDDEDDKHVKSTRSINPFAWTIRAVYEAKRAGLALFTTSFCSQNTHR
jgi:hypothetical protein